MRVLLDLEQRLQSWEVTLKDCQLPALTQEDVALVQQHDAALNLPATIREELDFDFDEMSSLARFSSFLTNLNYHHHQEYGFRQNLNLYLGSPFTILISVQPISFRDRIVLMTDEQREIFDLVMDRVTRGLPLQIFIDARGGCGKTFTLEAILAAARTSEPGGAVALAMATTGLAANLIPLGRTFHSRMKVGIIIIGIAKQFIICEKVGLDPTEEGCFPISVQSDLGRAIREAKFLMVDEATLADRRNFDKMQVTLRDVTGCNLPWGGKIVIFSGDFRLFNLNF